MSNLEILGVKIDNLTKTEILQKIQDFLNNGKKNYLVTINPEFIIEATKDLEFKNILNEADLKVVDGFGLVLAAWLKGKNIKNRFAGSDLTLEICRIAEQNNCSVFLLGGFGNTAELAGDNLKKQFPKLNIVGAEEGIIIANRESRIVNRDRRYTLHDIRNIQNSSLIDKINKTKPAILFVAFGHPKQEKWISQNLAKMPSVRLAIGVGGTFDYLAGKTHRAPRFMRNLGFEWLFRVIIEPWRVKRIFKAVVVFMWLAITEKSKTKK